MYAVIIRQRAGGSAPDSSPGTSAFTAAPASEHTHFTKAEQQPAQVPEQKTRE